MGTGDSKAINATKKGENFFHQEKILFWKSWLGGQIQPNRPHKFHRAWGHERSPLPPRSKICFVAPFGDLLLLHNNHQMPFDDLSYALKPGDSLIMGPKFSIWMQVMYTEITLPDLHTFCLLKSPCNKPHRNLKYKPFKEHLIHLNSYNKQTINTLKVNSLN